MRGALRGVGMGVAELRRPGKIEQIEIETGACCSGRTGGRSCVLRGAWSGVGCGLCGSFACCEGEKKREEDCEAALFHGMSIAAARYLSNGVRGRGGFCARNGRFCKPCNMKGAGGDTGLK